MAAAGRAAGATDQADPERRGQHTVLSAASTPCYITAVLLYQLRRRKGARRRCDGAYEPVAPSGGGSAPSDGGGGGADARGVPGRSRA